MNKFISRGYLMAKKIFLAIPFAAAITACSNLEETTGTTSAVARLRPLVSGWPQPAPFALTTVR